MSKQPEGPVAKESERLNKEAVKGINKVTKRAGKIAETTSTYKPQHEKPPGWFKPK
jgi:hypothetical protein